MALHAQRSSAASASTAPSNGLGSSPPFDTQPTDDAAIWFTDAIAGMPDSLDLRLGMLNGFELQSGRRTIELSSGSERLLAFLALADRPLMRNFVAFSLWPDKDEERAFGNLRSALWRIRQAGLGLVESVGPRLRLGREVSVDVDILRLIAQHVVNRVEIKDPARVREMLVAGDLLHDWYEPWVSPERERLRQLRLHALESLSEYLLALGDICGAIEAGLAAVAAEPLRESAHRVLISAHLTEGNLAEALRQYESYRYAASTELGVLPSSLMEDLVRPIRTIPIAGPR